MQTQIQIWIQATSKFRADLTHWVWAVSSLCRFNAEDVHKEGGGGDRNGDGIALSPRLLALYGQKEGVEGRQECCCEKNFLWLSDVSLR